VYLEKQKEKNDYFQGKIIIFISDKLKQGKGIPGKQKGK